MKELTSITAQRLLNLYRQAHVIEGGWGAVNQVLVAEAEEDVLKELQKLPSGTKLVQHIKSLKSGETPMNQIKRELMPYSGKMSNVVKVIEISDKDLQTLESVLKDFHPDEEHVNKIKNLDFVQSFGDNWIKSIRNTLLDKPDLLSKWDEVSYTARAYELWNKAYTLLTPPISERARAQAQADLPEYETYLPMFGEEGKKLLIRIRTFISSI
ncbi:MAG: hypothetical protein ACOX7D_02545 [Alphaproteobacteria bacterium]|jgi:hypothetical protein